MALDFHRIDNHDHLFALDDQKYQNLDEIFTEFKHCTGIFIDQYANSQLTIANQKALIKIIDNYIERTNLNLEKTKTIDIVEFRTFMKIYSDNELNIKILGD
ncbi:hypothetical protein ACFSX9_11765 [Flavobacterium ardleyense]|uniref:Uncharacterized protein n=1 Tax=Flavobacterium ardleyense TaxID=2038737 RepID=A0ABW5Z960_9FLAO